MILIDFSKWSKTGPVTVDELEQFKAEGVEGVCVQLWSGREGNEYAEEELRRARSIGLITAGYIVVTGSSRDHIGLGQTYAGHEWDYLSFVAVDVEVEGTPITVVEDAVIQVETLGARPIIYANFYFWKDKMGGHIMHNQVDLWDANWDSRANLSFPRQYGGWSSLVGKQFVGDTYRHGVQVDYNFFDDDWVRSYPKPNPLETDMDKATWQNALNVIWGISNKLDTLESPFANQLRDSVIAMKTELLKLGFDVDS